MLERIRGLRSAFEEVTDVDWRHPAWRAFPWVIAALEATGRALSDRDRFLYHSANGGPHSDTFMARPVAPLPDIREAVARMVVRAHTAVTTLQQLSDRLPGQPLLRALRWDGRWLDPVPLDREASRAVIFATPGCAFRAVLEAEGSPETVRQLTDALVGVLRGDGHDDRLTPVDVADPAPVRAAVAVSLCRESLASSRHVHRRVWSRGGGPWLGVSETSELGAVSTCHRVVDGFGHALISDRILVSSGADQEAQGGGSASTSPFPPGPASDPSDPTVGFAGRFLPEGVGRFVHQAHATGRALDRFFRSDLPVENRNALRWSPTFTVPIAPGSVEDEQRRARRVVNGVLAVGMDGGEFEGLEAFGERLNAWLARERSGQGLLSRIASSVARSRLPQWAKVRALSNHHGTNRWVPPVEALSGRARLSSIRFPSGDRPEAPLFAASLPVLLPTKADPLGSLVLTLIHHERGATVTVFGTGAAGHDPGAGRFLDLWTRELEQVRSPVPANW